MKTPTLIGSLVILALLMIAAAPVAGLSTTTITNSSDAITAVSTSSASAGTTVDVTITGVNFTPNTGSVRLEKSGEDEIDGNVLSWSASSIECSFKIPKATTTGKWNIVVVKGYDSTTIVSSGGFTISQSMTLTSVSPTSGQINKQIDYTITGSNLDDVAKVYLYNKKYDNITDTSPDISSDGKKATGTFDLSDASEAAYQVCLVDIYKATKCGLEFDVTTNKKGSIDVSSNPSGATIFLDGITNGTTPATLDNVIVGSHKIVLRKSGYEDWGKTLNVNDGETSEVDATLYASATPTPVQTTYPPLTYTTVPVTSRPTIKSTLKIPTTYADVPTPTPASPADPALILGAVCLGFIALRKP